MKKAINRYRFSLVLLFYNEEDNIVSVVSSLSDVLSREKINFQLVLVENGSTDRTPVLIKELIGKDTRIKGVVVKENRGYGWGVINGLKAAEGEWVGFMDGDAQIASEDVARFFQQADPEKYDMVKMRRLARRDGFIRAWVSEVYVMIFCLLFGIKIYDVNAKPVIFKRECLSRLALTCRDWFIDAELLLKADFLKMRIREVPVIFLKRNAGRSSVTVSTAFEFMKNIFRFRFGKELSQWKTQARLRS